MRTTVDLPDTLYRKTKAIAALRGSSMKDLILHALEQEIERGVKPEAQRRDMVKRDISKLPRIRLKGGRKLDLSNFDFDDLLA